MSDVPPPPTLPAGPQHAATTSAANRYPFSRVTAVIIALACVVVAGIAVNITQNIGNEVVRTINVKQPGRLDNGIVTVTDVQAGTRVRLGEDDYYSSKGMILAITVRAEAPGQQFVVGGGSGVKLHTSDRTYSVFGSNTSISADAGFVSTGAFLFEVDPQHVAGAYLELFRSEVIHATPQKLHIRLGITAANAANWAASARGRTVSADYYQTKPL
jgi:hypothetical protein